MQAVADVRDTMRRPEPVNPAQTSAVTRWGST